MSSVAGEAARAASCTEQPLAATAQQVAVASVFFYGGLWLLVVILLARGIFRQDIYKKDKNGDVT